MPSRRNRRRNDGNNDAIPLLPPPPPPPSVFDPSQEAVEIPMKYRMFMRSQMGIDLDKFDSETLKKLKPDQKKIIIDQMLRPPVPQFKTKDEAYSFFDYKEEPKIVKKVKEPITNDYQKSILSNLKTVVVATPVDTKVKTTEKKKEKQLFSPQKMSVAINIKSLSKDVDMLDEESIKQKISQYTDLISVIDEDVLNFPDYYTKLKEEVDKNSKDPYLFIKDRLGNSVEEMKQTLQDNMTSLYEKLRELNQRNTIKKFNEDLDSIEAKVKNEEDKISLKETQANLMKTDKVVFLFKLNDTLKLKGDYSRLYDALSQIDEVKYFSDIFSTSPLVNTVFEEIKVEKNPEIKQLETVYDVKSDIEAIDERIKNIIEKIRNVEKKKEEINGDLIKYYGFTFESGLKLLNDMIQYKDKKEKMALKEAGQLLVNSMLARARRVNDGTIEGRKTESIRTNQKMKVMRSVQRKKKRENDLDKKLYEVARQLKYYFVEGSKEDLKVVYKMFFKENKNIMLEWSERYNGDLLQMVQNNQNSIKGQMLKEMVKQFPIEVDLHSGKMYGEEYYWDSTTNQLRK